MSYRREKWLLIEREEIEFQKGQKQLEQPAFSRRSVTFYDESRRSLQTPQTLNQKSNPKKTRQFANATGVVLLDRADYAGAEEFALNVLSEVLWWVRGFEPMTFSLDSYKIPKINHALVSCRPS
jgi:hypothetical protein